MKILAIGNGRIDPNSMDGGCVRFIEICRRLINQGHQVHILLPIRDKRLLEGVGLNAAYHVLPEFYDRISKMGIAATYLKRIFGSCRYRIGEAFDIIYAPSDYLFDVVPAIFFKRENKDSKLVAIMFHIIAPPHKRRGRSLYVNLLSFLSQRLSIFLLKRYADLIFAQNEGVESYLRKVGVPPMRVKMIPTGIDIEFIEKSISDTKLKKEYDACFVGRINPAKGIFDLVDIWKLVVAGRSEARLVIIGGGDRKIIGGLKNKIEKENMGENIKIKSWMEDKRDVFRTMKSSEIFVFPSYEEGWGLAICEAMVCKLPIVAYGLPVYKKIYGGRLVTVPIGEKENFAQAILCLLADVGLRRVKGEEGYRWVKRYDWDKIASREIGYLGELIGKSEASYR